MNRYSTEEKQQAIDLYFKNGCNMKKTVRLAGIAYESLVNGPGIRRVFFAQGCKHNCKGCFNPETHSFDKGIVLEIDKLIKDVLENPMITGVTFSGGDPIEQAHSFSYMAKILKNKVENRRKRENNDRLKGMKIMKKA